MSADFMIDHGYPFIVLDRYRSESDDTTVGHVTWAGLCRSDIYLDVKILYPMCGLLHHQSRRSTSASAHVVGRLPHDPNRPGLRRELVRRGGVRPAAQTHADPLCQRDPGTGGRDG